MARLPYFLNRYYLNYKFTPSIIQYLDKKKRPLRSYLCFARNVTPSVSGPQ